jgi:hypothetical protein
LIGVVVISCQIALVSETDFVSPADLMRVGAAIQKQVENDFSPVWGVRATISPLGSLRDLSSGYWPVVIRDDIGPNLPGAHWNETQLKPFALVTYQEDEWTLTTSHEVLEMLADPFGKTFMTGPSLQADEGTVEYLVEVCDPCQDGSFGYTVDGVIVSDFVLPAYYNASGSGQYSFAKNIKEPRDVLDGGYVSWRDPVTENWTQYVVSKAGPAFRSLGANPAPPDIHLRGFIDRSTAKYLAEMAAPNANKPLEPKLAVHDARTLHSRSTDARRAEGARWRRVIDRLIGKR